MIATLPYVVVIHRPSKRAYTLNENYEVLEPLIFKAKTPEKFENARWGWTSPNAPRWTWGRRDIEFEAYWLRR